MALSVSIFLLSTAALAYELLLMRLLSIVEPHHFAYMVISLALLGYGASGTFLTLVRRRLEARFALAYGAAAVLFALLAPAAFAVGQRIPFDPLEVVWDRRQLLYLVALYLCLAVPFFCAATAIGLALSRHRDAPGRIYGADLAGAGTGAAAAVAALFVLSAAACLRGVSGLGLAAAAVAAVGGAGEGRRWWRVAGLLLLACAVPVLWPGGWIEPRPSEYKGLSKTLELPEAEVVAERSSPLALLTTVASPRIPFRHAPGLSLTCPHPVPEQLGLFADGDALTVVDGSSGDLGRAGYLDCLPAAVPYRLRQAESVLVVGLGGGVELRDALVHGATWIEVAEIDPDRVALLAGPLTGYSGKLLARPEVAVTVSEARSYLARSARRFDLIAVTPEGGSGGAAGVEALAPSTLFTVEGVGALLDGLRRGGLLAVTGWLKVPPRDSLKLFATAAEALERRGVAEPGRRLALFRSWSTFTLLVKKGALEAEEVNRLRRLCKEGGWDLAYYPGMPREEANRHNVLDAPYLYDGARALLSPQREDFLRRYKFDLRPATDDRPYFSRFQRWRSLPELLALRSRGGAALVEWGYLVLLATLLQAAVAGVVLVLLPLLVKRRPAAGRGGGGVVLYFLCLGLAFLFLEIAFIQRLTVFLGHPLYAAAVVLGAFLVFAGLGSGASEWLRRQWPEWRERLPRRLGWLEVVDLPVAAIVVLAVLVLASMSRLIAAGMQLPALARVGMAVAVLAPLAFAMGMPFPLGLELVGKRRPEWVPWAWAVNGCASVLAAVLATMMGVHLGFSVVVGVAVGLYAVAVRALRWIEGVPLIR